MKDKIIIEKFWNEEKDSSVLESELGWPQTLKEGAQSDYSETIFRYIIEQVGFNLVFYWIKDRNFYVIETEQHPIEVRKLYKNPNWDGKFEFMKVGLYGEGASSCSAGEVIATFTEETEIWNLLKIDGVSIGEILEQSLIVTWD